MSKPYMLLQLPYIRIQNMNLALTSLLKFNQMHSLSLEDSLGAAIGRHVDQDDKDRVSECYQVR